MKLQLRVETLEEVGFFVEGMVCTADNEGGWELNHTLRGTGKHFPQQSEWKETNTSFMFQGTSFGLRVSQMLSVRTARGFISLNTQQRPFMYDEHN